MQGPLSYQGVLMNRQLVYGFSIVAILCLSAMAAEVRANQCTWFFTGIVSEVDSSLRSRFSISTRIQGSFTFEDSVADVAPSMKIGLYVDPFLSAAASFSNGYTVTIDRSPTASQSILVDDNGFQGDSYIVSAGVRGQNVNGLTARILSLYIRDYNYQMLSSDDLLSLPPNRALAEEFRGTLSFQTADGASYEAVRFDLTSLRGVRTIPEPSTTTLFYGMIAALLPIRRRLARQKAESSVSAQAKSDIIVFFIAE